LAVRLRVDSEILEKFPGYTAVVLYARNLENGESDVSSTTWLREAEAFARREYAEPVSGHPHIQAWRAAFSAFGSKPSKYLCSAEALLKRVLRGEEIPAINRAVDAYNAVSIRHAVPAGGEDLDRLESDLHLAFASGQEPFDVMAGEGAPEHPDPGEVVWKDTAGVTCRRWNWRQGIRTRIDLQTRQAWFVLERLEPMPLAAAMEAAVALMETLRQISPAAGLTARLIDRIGTTEIS